MTSVAMADSEAPFLLMLVSHIPFPPHLPLDQSDNFQTSKSHLSKLIQCPRWFRVHVPKHPTPYFPITPPPSATQPLTSTSGSSQGHGCCTDYVQSTITPCKAPTSG